MQFVIHAMDKKDGLHARAKSYQAHRVHLDDARTYGVEVLTAGPLVAEDGETPVGSLFIVEANDRAAVEAFTQSDPYHVNGVWDAIEIHYYRKKRG